MAKLNLGCGRDIKKGYINTDIVKLPGVDVVHDLEKTPIPFEDNTFDEVFISHILDHVKNYLPLLEELHRVCKNGAILKITQPYFASHSAFSDPNHCRYFTTRTFNNFEPGNYNNFYTTARFKVMKKRLKFTRKDWLVNRPIEFIVNLIPEVYERFFCFMLPFQEIYFELKVVK